MSYGKVFETIFKIYFVLGKDIDNLHKNMMKGLQKTHEVVVVANKELKKTLNILLNRDVNFYEEMSKRLDVVYNKLVHIKHSYLQKIRDESVGKK